MRLIVMAKARPPDGGGVERFGNKVATALADLGHTVELVAPGQEHQDELSSSTVQETWIRPGSQLLVAVGFLRFLAARLSRSRRRAEVPVLVTTTWRPALAALPFRLLGRVRLIVCCHGRELQAVPRALRPLRGLVLRYADALVASSPTTASVVASLVPRRNVVVHLLGPSFDETEVATSRAASPRVPSANLRLLTVCRFEPRKNLEALVQALARCRDQGIVFSATIVGTGETMLRVQELVTALNLGEIVDLPGRVSDERLLELYANATAFLHPQISLDRGRDFEGFGLTIADAMLFGLPVVVGKTGAPADFVAHERDGLVVDGTDVSAIAEAIATLSSDPALATRLGEAGRRRCQQDLSWSSYAKTIVKALEE